MLGINEWRLLNEAFGSMTLGLGRKPSVGFIGSQIKEDKFGEKDFDDEEDDEDDYDGQQTDDDDGLEGDLIGSSSPDEGPDKDFPPDDSEGMDGLPTPDEEMLGGDEGGADMFGGPEGGPEMLGGPEGGGNETDFLGDIDPALLGGEEGMEGMGGEPMPCPECNPDGSGEGDPECPCCQGEGFVEEDPNAQDPNLQDPHDTETPDFTQEDDATLFMRKYMKKDDKGCCENDEFLGSLAKMAEGNHRRKNSASGIREDALFQLADPNSNLSVEPTAGNVGFAPQGRVGSIGGGYSKEDFSDIPVMENRYPTLKQYRKWKRANSSKR